MKTQLQHYQYNIFLEWFVVMIFWLPTSIGGWLVHFGVISAGEMWLGSFIIGAISALYLAFTTSRSSSLSSRT